MTRTIGKFAAFVLLASASAAVMAAEGGAASKIAASEAFVPPEIEKAMQLPDGKEKADALAAAVKAWAKTDPTAGLAWLVALPPKLYGQARGGAAAFAQGADPNISADWLVQNPSRTALEVLHGVLLSWTMNDPNAATAWCVRLQSKDANARHVSFYSVTDGLCRRKPGLAAAWITQLPAGEDRVSAVGGAITIWARGDIVAATAWIKTLDQPELKRAAQVVVGVWRFVKGTKDSPNPWRTVQEWLDQTPLAPADKEYVLKHPQS